MSIGMAASSLRLVGRQGADVAVRQAPRRADTVGRVVEAQALAHRPGEVAAQASTLGHGRRRGSGAWPSPLAAAPLAGEEGLDIGPARLERIARLADETAEHLDVGARGAGADGQREGAEVRLDRLLPPRDDANGDRTATTPSSGSAWAYTYDALNQLTQSQLGGGTATTYAYDGDGLRASKTTGSTTTSFAWDDAGSLPLLIEETTGSNVTTYVYGPTGQPLEEILPGGGTYYYSHDALGSTRALTDSSGLQQATDTFGPIRKSEQQHWICPEQPPVRRSVFRQ